MFFQSKKKRLWRLRVTQTAQNVEKLTSPIYTINYNDNYNNKNNSTLFNLNKKQCTRVEDCLNRATNYLNYSCEKQNNNEKYPKEKNIVKEIDLSSSENDEMIITKKNVFGNCCGRTTNSNQLKNETNNIIVNEQKEIFRTLMGKLKESQLTTLCRSIETDTILDHCQTDCILVQRDTIMGEESNLIACRIWRWPDLKDSMELKRIPSCLSENDPIYVCCNPSHWSRICFTDSPPPPYHFSAMERLNSKGVVTALENYELFPESLTTDGEDISTSCWCQLAYWELSQRVGGRFPVENSSVNIFSDQARGDGMCLKTLSEQRGSVTPEAVIKTRQKIGLGITLSQEADGIWLYNRSLAPVFVHSPTINDNDNWLQVSKVPPGHCIRAFDKFRAKNKLVWSPYIAGSQTGPVDTRSMRISFAKGWGPNYSRQDVTACPCWLEVLLSTR